MDEEFDYWQEQSKQWVIPDNVPKAKTTKGE